MSVKKKLIVALRERLEAPVLDSSGKDSSNIVDDWDVTGHLGADLLSEACSCGRSDCGEMRILPAHYLNMLQTMSVEVLNGNITKNGMRMGCSMLIQARWIKCMTC